MSSTAQVLANRTNAQSSTGPVTDAGKARSSRNATTLGLFSVRSIVSPQERDAYNEFCAGWIEKLNPEGPVEATITGEILHAAWRLERCQHIEFSMDSEDQEELDRVQASIDRARATAQRSLYRGMNELTRLQTERQYRVITVLNGTDPDVFGQAKVKALKAAVNQAQREGFMSQMAAINNVSIPRISERSQSEPEPDIIQTPRSAPCPCGSGEKYKRCCGKNAPPVLGRAA